MKESFLSKTMSLSFTSLNPGMTLEPKDTSAWGSLLPCSVGKSPSQTRNRKAETPLRRLKKTLQDNLSLSSKLFLRGLYSASTKTVARLAHFPALMLKRVVNAVFEHPGIDHPVGAKARGYSWEHTTLATADFDLTASLPVLKKPAGE